MCHAGGGILPVQWLCAMRASCVAVGDSSGRLDPLGERPEPWRVPGKLDERIERCEIEH